MCSNRGRRRCLTSRGIHRSKLDTPFTHYNCDAELSGFLKEAFGKRKTKNDMASYRGRAATPGVRHACGRS